ncbi:phospholipid carrier-dependent glycosyltransferase [Flavobacteriaceae bacterium Ap0902]|nr:phospholipid carrier-dependent glycosyltransferase [Flavobacteriaceae bacterium Ap0902]
MLLNRKSELLVVFIISLFLCAANIWGYPISILDEAKNAEAAREMFQGHAFLPTFNDFLRTDKPPLHYFFMQFGYTLFGVNEWGARFFGALLGAGFITYFYAFLRKHIFLNVARLALMILWCSFFWIQEFHLAVPDPYLLAFLGTGWLLFFEFYKSGKQGHLWLFYICIGLATLAKGPVAIGLTGLNVLLFLIIQRKFSISQILKFKPILGGLIVLLISAPWFIWIHFTTDGAFTQGFFVQHNLERFNSEMEGHGGIFLITWLFVLLGLFPFGAFIPQGLWHGYKFYKRSDLIGYSLVVSVVVIGFFSISGTKLPNYTLPAMPFLAILVGGYLEETMIYKTGKSWQNTVSLSLISLVSLALPVAVYILFDHPLLSNPQVYIAVPFMLLMLASLGYIWVRYLKRNDFKWIYSIAVLWVIISLTIFFFIYPNLSKITPVVQAETYIKNKEVVVYKNYDPAFNFNFQRTFTVFHREEELIEYLNKHPQTLVLTKNKVIRDQMLFKTEFQTIFRQPTVFENYDTVILRYIED